MTLIDIRQKLKESMIAKNSERTNVIRLLLSAINYYGMERNIKPEDLTDGDIATVVLKELKKKQESLDQFIATNDEERANSERLEIDILQEFAPQMMNEDQVRQNIRTILTSNQGKDFGPLMGMVMKELKGKAETGMIQKVLKEEMK